MSHDSLISPRLLRGLVFAFIVGLGTQPARAKQKEVPVSLTPVAAESSMLEEHKALPPGRALPSLWGHFPVPYFPRELERVGVEGEVTVEFVVNQHGYVIYAKILQATDERFGLAVIETLQWIRPLRMNEPSPALPARFVMPIGFSVGDRSDIRDKKLVAKITTKPPTTKPLMFSRPSDYDPQYPGIAEARRRLKRGMSRLQVVETIGFPIVESTMGIGVVKYGYGPDIIDPELVVVFEDDRLVDLKDAPRLSAPKKR